MRCRCPSRCRWPCPRCRLLKCSSRCSSTCSSRCSSKSSSRSSSRCSSSNRCRVSPSPCHSCPLAATGRSPSRPQCDGPLRRHPLRRASTPTRPVRRVCLPARSLRAPARSTSKPRARRTTARPRAPLSRCHGGSSPPSQPTQRARAHSRSCCRASPSRSSRAHATSSRLTSIRSRATPLATTSSRASPPSTRCTKRSSTPFVARSSSCFATRKARASCKRSSMQRTRLMRSSSWQSSTATSLSAQSTLTARGASASPSLSLTPSSYLTRSPTTSSGSRCNSMAAALFKPSSRRPPMRAWTCRTPSRVSSLAGSNNWPSTGLPTMLCRSRCVSAPHSSARACSPPSCHASSPSPPQSTVLTSLRWSCRSRRPSASSASLTPSSAHRPHPPTRSAS
mmetsp:Transcript_19711/g.54098  ORF Transcript_19711/g.54098 Transcript_19711/m.54098 type:complete len:395 (-) Transcript_19711:1016-2200(-)